MNKENMNTGYLDQVIRGELEDQWFHYGITSKDPVLARMRDVRAVVLAGSGQRIGEFAEHWGEKRAAPVFSLRKEERFVFRYADQVIFSSHGMGMPGASIAMHELMKMIYFLKNGSMEEIDKVFWIRMGTSGGLGLPGGKIVISTEGLQSDLKPYRLYTQGRERWFSGKFPENIARQAALTAQEQGIDCILGKTVGCNDFYLEQGRMDGAVNFLGEGEKMAWLRSLYEQGVRNIEMETPMFAGILNHWGFSRFAAACTVIVNRLESDQVRISDEEHAQYVLNAEKFLFAYLEKQERSEKTC